MPDVPLNGSDAWHLLTSQIDGRELSQNVFGGVLRMRGQDPLDGRAQMLPFGLTVGVVAPAAGFRS